MSVNNITLNLKIEEVNLILSALSKLPFEVVADLIVNIRSQGNEQIKGEDNGEND